MSFVINTGPILTAVWARLLLNEIVSRAGYFSFAVCFAGIVLIFSGETSLSLVHPAALFVAVAAIAGSLYFVIQKPFLNRYSSVQVVSVAVWCGTLFMVPFAQDVIGEVKAAPIQTLWIVVYLGVFPGALALTSWSYALSRLSASHAAIFLYCIPPATILLAWLTLGELPEITSILGGFVVLAGVALFQFYSRAPSVSVNGGAHDLP